MTDSVSPQEIRLDRLRRYAAEQVRSAPQDPEVQRMVCGFILGVLASAEAVSVITPQEWREAVEFVQHGRKPDRPWWERNA